MWAEWPFLPDPSNLSCFLSCSHWLEEWRPGLPWKPLVKDDKASVGLDHWMTAPSKVFPTSCLHAPLQIHYHCLPTALCVNKMWIITWSHEIQIFFYFSQGYISWKDNESLSLGTPHIHGPLQRTKKGPWKWFHVVIFVFFPKFAKVKCFSYKW